MNTPTERKIGPRSALSFVPANFAAYEIRPRVHRLTNLTPCKGGFPF